MPSGGPSPLPDVGAVLAPLLERLAPERRPLLVALAERLAARRYLTWAEEPANRAHAAELRACADRESEIATRVEALFPDAGSAQREILAQNPDIEEINRALFADLPLDAQLATQARGERLGAATWRALAKSAEPAAREIYLACAELEEASAEVLDAVLASRAPEADLRRRREETVRLHMEAENRHEFDTVMGTFGHPRYELIATDRVHDGEAEVRDYFRETRGAFPDQRNELISLRHADDAVVTEFWLLGTHRGPLGPLAPTGREFRCRMTALFIFEGADLVCERVYFDSATILRQLTGGEETRA